MHMFGIKHVCHGAHIIVRCAPACMCTRATTEYVPNLTDCTCTCKVSAYQAAPDARHENIQIQIQNNISVAVYSSRYRYRYGLVYQQLGRAASKAVRQ